MDSSQRVTVARRSLYFQNQYINVGKRPAEGFLELIEALRGKMAELPDVRLILRDLPTSRDMLESLQALGFDPGRIRFQPGCHTKGIIVDGETVLLGSHNWSSSGTQDNRDASLIIHEPRVAKFYEQIFLYDWSHLARPKILAEETFGLTAGMPLVVDPGPSGASERVTVSWDALFED